MENHPIPQDITGFQFKLIGKMTVRQFAYLATGVIIAWVFYILPLPFIIRLPFIIIFSVLGAAFAFLPIDGRPMDTMFINFIKALFAPTDYIYQKEGGKISAQPIQDQTLQQQAPSIINLPPPAPVAPASTQPSMTIDFPQAQQAPLPPLNLDEDEKKQETQKIEENEKKLQEEAEHLKRELEEAKKQEAQAPSQPEVHQKAEELERILIETQRQKEALEQELIMLRAKLEDKPEMFTPSVATPLPQTQNVKKIPQEMQKAAGIASMPQEPNLITGVIKDPRSNPLQNIIVEVKDANDNPVRAFKTNGLGQFASATSLSNGKYKIVFEDPKGENKFDAVEVEATGTPIMPLEIISVDPREELRRELFTT
ncbi:MAG: PrgI family protein [Patescibacteria group bacterium]